MFFFNLLRILSMCSLWSRRLSIEEAWVVVVQGGVFASHLALLVPLAIAPRGGIRLIAQNLIVFFLHFGANCGSSLGLSLVGI